MSEERIVPSATEFASAASRVTVLATNVLQALLVAAVVLWVLNVPRQLFDAAFYTEQLLTVCLGLSLALAYVAERRPRRPSRFDWSGGAASLGIIAYALFRYAGRGDVPASLMAVLALCLIWTVVGSRPGAARWFDWGAAAASLAICGYIAVRYDALTHEIALMPLEGIVGSAVLILLVLEASRRISGFGFVSIIIAMAIYIFVSPHFPGEFQTRPVAPERLLVYLGLDTNGMISSILQVAVLVVIPFTILGQVLARTGGAEFFSDIAMAAMGRRRGGAGKIAVVGSGLFGMISGSAVSNVLAVGIVTIPTMIRSGFTPYRAAAIESVGSTGGQLMPPVMGASAFIMAEFLQVSYGAVCIAAAIPAFLYYACLFMHVDLEAAKHKIGAAAIADAPGIGEVLKSGWHFLIPIGFLVAALIYPEVFRLTPEKVAIVSTLMLMVLTSVFGYRGRRISIPQMLKAMIETGRVSLDIILIGAAAGLMVGILSISGLAFGMTLQLVALSGDNVFLLLLFIAVLAFLLGIGLPTVSVYILTATLLAPALIKLGVTPMAAHMFVMYNGMLSMITPPVAFAAYAAANIARTDGWTTGWIACLVGWSTFVLPFLFVLTPSLLMDGSAAAIILNFVRVLFGIYLGTAAVVGFALVPLTLQSRAVYALLALLVVLPPETFSGAIGVNVVSAALALALLARDRLRRRSAGDRLANLTQENLEMSSKGIAVITGGASGIGEATARRMAADGYGIAIVDMNAANGEKVAKSIGTTARFYACDVADAKAVDAAAARIESELGPVHILVTAAGLIPNTESVMEMDMAAHERMWRVNYDGTIHSCRAFARPMIARKRGAIVTLGSINSRLPLPLPAYNPGKAAVERLTQLLAVELGRHGIRVNSVAPTYVMTPPLRAKVETGQRDLNKIMGVHALAKLPEPADIADGIAFLCSEQAKTITGILLPIDAGWLAAVSYRTYAGGVPWAE